MSATDNLKAVAEQLEALPDRLAALLGAQQGSVGGGSARSGAAARKPSAFDQLGTYGLIEDTYQLKEDVGKKDVNPPKAPWGDEADVYQAGPRQAKELPSHDPTDAWRGKFKLPGTSLSLGSMSAGVVGAGRQVRDAEQQWNDAVDWRPGQDGRARPSPAGPGETQQQKQSDTMRRLTEVMEQLKDEVERLREAMADSDNESTKEGQGGSVGVPPIGQSPWDVLMARTSGT